MSKTIYNDFENYRTEKEVIELINIRINELCSQGFTRRQIFIIIFKSEYFKNNFLDEQTYTKLKKRFYEAEIKNS